MRPYPSRALDALSQLANVLLLDGEPNESISGRAHRCGWAAERWIDRLFFWQINHCRSAYSNDLAAARVAVNEYKARVQQ